LQLAGDNFTALDGALLQNTYRGGVRQCLRHPQFVAVQPSGTCLEQVERADHLAA